MTDKLMLKKIRHQTVRNLLKSKKAFKTISTAHRFAYLVDQYDYTRKRAKKRVAIRLKMLPESTYEYYKRYLVERRIVQYEMEH